MPAKEIVEWMPPAFFVGVVALMLAGALWLGWYALHSVLIIEAVARTPEGDFRTPAGTRVKLRGVARPPASAPGMAASSIVWQKTRRQGGGGSYTVGHFLIEAPTGIC